MKTKEELQHELLTQTTEVEGAIIKLDKASLILGRWMNEFASSTKMPDKSKWFYEYSQIVGLVDIAFDYVYESKKALEKAVYGDKANEGAA